VTYPDIDRHRLTIQRVLDRGKALDPGDPIRADLAKFVCVLVSGYIEQTMKRLVLIHCTNRGAAPTVQRHVEKQLKRFQNALVFRIYELVNTLDPAIEEQARQLLSAEQEAAIDSVVNLRHQFAHGGQAGTSLAQQETYFGEIEGALLQLRTLLA
jgi:hypothetical protein